MRVMYVHEYDVDLVSAIVRSAFAHDTGPTSGFMVWGTISYNSRLHLVFLQDKINTASYIAQVVNPVLLPYLRQEGDVLFQQDNAHPHSGAATQRALRGVQQLLWPTRIPRLLAN